MHGTRKQFSGFCLVVERKRKLGELALEVATQVIGHVLPGRLDPPALQKSQAAFSQRQPQQAKDSLAQHRNILSANTLINDPADELGDGHVERVDAEHRDVLQPTKEL